ALLPPDPNCRWPENQLYYAIPFLIEAADIDTAKWSEILPTLYSPNTTGIAALVMGHVPGSTDGSELVVWLSGHKMTPLLHRGYMLLNSLMLTQCNHPDVQQ
ncbi:hypothetical protein BS47DRAFT_1344140, partial [Hydnum rufescens UP504]